MDRRNALARLAAGVAGILLVRKIPIAAATPVLARPVALTGAVSKSAVHNVMDYGAKGDGLTDDYASVMAANAALTAAGYGVLFFPRGVYNLGDGAFDAGDGTWQGAFDASGHGIWQGSLR